jgi:predicted dehydrogenase
MPGRDSRIALGLVGLGKIACDQHLRAIAHNTDFKLVATADPSRRIDGLKGYDSLAEMLAARPDIAAVSFCTPPSARVELATQALQAGCHVMLEKPPALNVEAAEQLATLAKYAGQTLFATWHSRESRCVDEARAWLSGRTIRRAVINWREDIRLWHPGQDWILDRDGFGVFDPGINALSILTALVPGEIQLAEAALEVPANRAAPIAANLTLTMPGGTGAAVTLDFLNSGEQVWDLTLETDQGRLLLRRGGHELWIDDRQELSCTDEEYPRLYRRFAKLLQGGRSGVDFRPLGIVADALARGNKQVVAPFEF